VIQLVRKLTARCETAQFRYEAGLTGYGLDRQIVDLGRSCRVVAPSLIPRRPGKRVETNRRDPRTLVRLLRARAGNGALTPGSDRLSDIALQSVRK
jgi:hypothetical protein